MRKERQGEVIDGALMRSTTKIRPRTSTRTLSLHERSITMVRPPSHRRPTRQGLQRRWHVRLPGHLFDLHDRVMHVLWGLSGCCAQMLMDLGPNVYQEDFERAFLQEAAEFYQVRPARSFHCSVCAVLRRLCLSQSVMPQLGGSSMCEWTALLHMHR